MSQFYRDWSSAGQEERDASYLPVLNAVEKRFPPATHDTKAVNILVPGAGLGRLAHEFARRGYNCQGNEWSLYMLLASNFVLNKWVTVTTNVEYQLSELLKGISGRICIKVFVYFCDLSLS